MLIGTYFGIYVAGFVSSGLSGPTRTWASDFAYLPLDAAAIALAVAAGRRGTLPPRVRQAWWLVAAAMTARCVGDTSWWWLEGVKQQSPFPSVADIGFVAFFPLMLVALLRIPVRSRGRRELLVLTLDVAAIAGSGFLVIWFVALGPAVQAGANSMAAVLNAVYNCGDLVLIVGASRVLLRGTEITVRRPMRWLLTSLCAFVTADVVFAYLSLQSSFEGGEWLDIVWIGAIGCVGVAADQQRRHVPNPLVAARERIRSLGVRVTPPAKLPYVVILLSYAVMIKAFSDLPLNPYGGLLAGDVALTVVVVIRQLLTSRDHAILVNKIDSLSSTDALTGALTRRHMLELAERELTHAPHGSLTGALMIDLDHFKAINDTHGHLAGDQALRSIAELIRANLRQTDLLGRYGGDELFVLMPNTSAEGARDIADRLVLAAQRQRTAGDRQITPTLSIGVAIGHTDSDLDTLLAQADKALYAAKAAGRNQAADFHGLVPVQAPAGSTPPIGTTEPSIQPSPSIT